MAAGDTTVLGPYKASDKTNIATDVAAQRVSANDQWLVLPSGSSTVMLVHIEESA